MELNYFSVSRDSNKKKSPKKSVSELVTRTKLLYNFQVRRKKLPRILDTSISGLVATIRAEELIGSLTKENFLNFKGLIYAKECYVY